MDSKIKTTIETINPELAREYLKANTFNRPVSLKTVHLYASAMSRGQWELNGEPVIFSSDGRLLDGQQRLLAIIEANVGIRVLVVRGVDAGTFDTINQGKTRTGADVLSMQGVNNASRVSSIIAQYMTFRAGWNANDTGPNLKELKLTKRDLLAEYNVRASFWDEITYYAQKIYKKRRLLTPSEIGSNIAFLILQKKYPSRTIYPFYDQLFGIDEVKNNTIQLLRDKIVDASLKGYKLNAKYKQALLIKAFNAYITGKEYKILSYSLNREDYPSYI